MSELNGLRNVIANSGTMHGITSPPQREDFESAEEFEKAHSDWWVRTNCWTVTVRDADKQA